MKCDCVSWTFNQITSTNEILLDINHSSMYTAHKIDNRLVCQNLFESYCARLSDTEQIQQRER